MAIPFVIIHNRLNEIVNENKLLMIEIEIDEKLSACDFQWLKGIPFEQTDDYSWSSRNTDWSWSTIIHYELTGIEKRELAKHYIDAGWPSIKIMNADDNSGLEGTCVVFLYSKEQDFKYIPSGFNKHSFSEQKD